MENILQKKKKMNLTSSKLSGQWQKAIESLSLLDLIDNVRAFKTKTLKGLIE